MGRDTQASRLSFDAPVLHSLELGNVRSFSLNYTSVLSSPRDRVTHLEGIRAVSLYDFTLTVCENFAFGSSSSNPSLVNKIGSAPVISKHGLSGLLEPYSICH